MSLFKIILPYYFIKEYSSTSSSTPSWKFTSDSGSDWSETWPLGNGMGFPLYMFFHVTLAQLNIAMRTSPILVVFTPSCFGKVGALKNAGGKISTWFNMIEHNFSHHRRLSPSRRWLGIGLGGNSMGNHPASILFPKYFWIGNPVCTHI